ncbi:MAG: uncharacterized protein JWN95_2310 [Frankiales bacterium]|nr:uncharacterized protein [Frankiales bacterium]
MKWLWNARNASVANKSHQPSAAHPGTSERSTGLGGAQMQTNTSDLRLQFRAAWSAASPDVAEPELLPTKLARAAAQVLPISAAGLSMLDSGFRVPLGASDELATVAERLQFTQGEGPCLDAANSGRIFVTGPSEMAARWPMFTHELVERTPYRAIICLPLPLTSGLAGALDLYLEEPDQLRAVPIADASMVADQMTEALLAGLTMTGSVTPWSGDREPAWMHSPAARERVQAWVAMGMLMTRMSLSARDALTLLRAYAYSHGTVLDDVAEQLVTGSLDVEQLAS